MSHIKKCSLLDVLITRGDQIEIINGQLLITPASKKPVPKKWLSKNLSSLLIEIVKLFDLNVYIYDSYSTGNYGKHKSAGVTLQFNNLTTGEDCYVTFNVELKRDRSTNSGIKGGSLPKGKFRVSKKHKFYKFWLSSGLKLPPRLSSFHDYMGNLKKLAFVPTLGYNTKVQNKIIPLLNLSHIEILAKYSHNIRTDPDQYPYNNHTTLPYNKPYKSPIIRGGHADISTGLTNYGLSKQGSAVISLHIPESKRPEEQTVDEWLNDLDNA